MDPEDTHGSRSDKKLYPASSLPLLLFFRQYRKKSKYPDPGDLSCRQQDSMTAGLTGSLVPFSAEPDGRAFVQLERHSLTIKDVNPAFALLIGADDPETLKGIPPELWLYGPTPGEVRNEIDRILRGASTNGTLAGRLLLSNGKAVSCDIHVELAEDGDIHLQLIDRQPENPSDELLRLSLELDRRIQRGYSLEALLTLCARRIAEHFHFLFVYFVVPEPDGNLKFVAIESAEPEPKKILRELFTGIRWDIFPGNTLPCAIAAKTLMPCFRESLAGADILTQTLSALGTRSVFALPVRNGRNPFPRGILAIGTLSPAELSLSVRDRLLDFSEKIGLAFDNQDKTIQSESEKNAIFEGAPDGIYIADADSLRILDANRTMCDLLGFSDKADLVGKTVLAISTTDEQTVRSAIADLDRSGKPSSTVHRNFKRKDGTLVPVSISFGRLTYRGMNAYMCHVRDITRDREDEAVRRISNEMDRQILEGAPLEALLARIVDGIADTFGFPLVYFALPNPDGTLRYSKIRSRLPEIARTLEEAGKSMKWNTPPGNRRVGSRALKSRKPIFTPIKDFGETPLLDAFVRAGVRASFVIPILRETPEQLPWGILTMASELETSLSERVREILLDLSEKVRMAFLRFDEQNRIRLQQTAMESARSPFLITTPEGIVEWANPAFMSMIGQSGESITPIGLQELFPDAVGEEHPVTLLDIVRAGTFFQGEIPGHSRSGDTFITETIVSPIRDAHERVTHMLIHMKDITVEKVQANAIWELAHVDSLTGLLNWTAFMDILDREIHRARETGQELAVLFLDLDGFKEINDTMGHETGNRFLQVIGSRLQQCSFISDTVSRIGGDEFVLLCKKKPCDRKSLTPDIKNLMDFISRPVDIDGRHFQTTVSVGVSFYPADAEKSADLVRKSDIAMYQAKKGKKGWRFFDTQMEERIRQRYESELALRKGLREKQIFLMYQPQVDMAKNRILGVEALVRWKRDDGAIHHPKSFIPLAEESGIILELGESVLEQAFETLHRWNTDTFCNFRVSVNVSPRQFWSRNFWTALTERIANQPGSGKRLCLELTESLLMQNPAEIGKRLSALREIGVRISIDDFGTGYSSLAYLSRFPVDEIKVPQEFVLRMKEHEQDRTIVKTIVQMALSLGIDLVGEGAETRSEIDMLLGLGCTTLQGYGIARPLPLEEAEDFMRQFPPPHGT